MSSQLFFPPPRIVGWIDVQTAVPLAQLLRAAGASCAATGEWTRRAIVLVEGEPGLIEKEAGDWTAVRIGVPGGVATRAAARYAALALAYALMDPVARESVRGLPWSRPAPPLGRPRRGQAQSGRERQRRLRERRRAASEGPQTDSAEP